MPYKNSEKAKACKKKWADANKEKIKLSIALDRKANPEKYKARNKKFKEKNKLKIKEENKIYRDKNKERIKEYNKKWYQENKHIRKAYRAKKYAEDPNFRVEANLRRCILSAIKNGYKSDSTLKLLGAPFTFVKEYIESQFESWMNWGNHGEYNENRLTWHIDHIIPCASFDLTKPEEQVKCFHYSNLRPLLAKENLIKSDKIIINPKPSVIKLYE